MKLYLAAVFTNNYKQGMKGYDLFNQQEQRIADTIPYILESFHYVKKDSYVTAMRDNGAKVFLDSGAFSAANTGALINLDDYISYIHQNRDIFARDGNTDMIAVLDGIGDPELTWRNQKSMEQQGVRPVPCFHYGEDESWLVRYLDEYDYLALGGMVRTSANDVIAWLDRIWNNYIMGADGPRVKTHAFGVTTDVLMDRYPWTSVDSSSWVQAGSFGTVVTEYGPIAVSSKSPSRHDEGRHVTTLAKDEYAFLKRHFESKGFTVERLGEEYASRMAWNMQHYISVGERVTAHHQKVNGITDAFRVMGLF